MGYDPMMPGGFNDPAMMGGYAPPVEQCQVWVMIQ